MSCVSALSNGEELYSLAIQRAVVICNDNISRGPDNWRYCDIAEIFWYSCNQKITPKSERKALLGTKTKRQVSLKYKIAFPAAGSSLGTDMEKVNLQERRGSMKLTAIIRLQMNSQWKELRHFISCTNIHKYDWPPKDICLLIISVSRF